MEPPDNDELGNLDVAEPGTQKQKEKKPKQKKDNSILSFLDDTPKQL